jgi:hypothetical protein
MNLAIGTDSEFEESLQGSWSRKFRNKLYASITKLMGFFNQK